MAPVTPGSSKRAGRALLFGILGIPLFWLLMVFPILAVIFGVKARKEIARSNGVLTGKGKATAGLILGIIGIALFALIVVLAIVNRDEVAATDLEEGQCVELDLEGDTVSSFTKQSCDDAHDGEVYAVEELDDGDYPGSRDVQLLADATCADEFERFIGLPVGESRYVYTFVYPTEDSWDDGDRDVSCIVYDPSGDEVTGSLEDSGE